MMGDLNANVGEGVDLDCGIGPYGLGTRNNNGHKLAELCQTNNLILTNTKKKKKKLYFTPNRQMYNASHAILSSPTQQMHMDCTGQQHA